MTIDDQIGDEDLQYDINMETAKISALSSTKIGKYEYLTGEEILPSNEKQIKTRSRKKQVTALEDLKPKELEVIEGRSDYNKKHLKNKDVFNELSKERIGDIYSTSKEIDFNNLIYYFKVYNLASMNLLVLKVH